MRVTEVIHAWGHENVRATHRTTIEITKEPSLTPRGDCIIAVKATKSVYDLSRGFKEAARSRNARIRIVIEAGGACDVVWARGDPRLSFTHPTDLVIRRSRYVCGRTVAVEADKAAIDLLRDLVQRLRNPNQQVRVTLEVWRP